MNTTDVTMVRLYLTEGEGRLEELLKHLHDREQVKGVTVFRGITGFGRSGKYHASSLLDLSLDLPLVIEFFDEPAKVELVLADLAPSFEPGHIVSWAARINADT